MSTDIRKWLEYNPCRFFSIIYSKDKNWLIYEAMTREDARYIADEQMDEEYTESVVLYRTEVIPFMRIHGLSMNF